MSYPFNTSLYDQIYTSISSVLMTEFPQNSEESTRDWYKRLLYEYFSYLQAKYESDTMDEKINPGQKPNKKKDTPDATNFTPTNTALFDTNIENALDIVSVDSNFSVYLFIEWIKLLLNPGDYIRVCIGIDQSDTPGANIPFNSIEFEFELTQLKILSINGISLNQMTEYYFDSLKLDPFLKAIFKIISFYSKGTTFYNYDSISDVAIVYLSETDMVTNSFKMGEILWKIKEITKPLFVNEIVLKSNLITENDGKLQVSKGSPEKSQRKKFNSRKYIKSTPATTEEMSSSIIQTLIISIFRSFYDFDPDTIDQNIFDYMFNNKDLTL